MLVFVRVLSGRNIPTEIEGSDTVDLLNHEILDLEGRTAATDLFWQDAQQETDSQPLQRYQGVHHLFGPSIERWDLRPAQEVRGKLL